MAPLRFICFVLMFVLIHGRDSSAETPQATKKTVAAQGSELEAAGRSPVIYDGVPAVADVGNTDTVLGGRKRMFKRGLGKETPTKEEISNREDSISGKDTSALNKKNSRNSQEHLKNQQDDKSVLKVKSLNLASLQENYGRESVDLASIEQLNSQSSKLVTSKSSFEGYLTSSERPINLQESADPFQNLESQKLLDSANDEIVKLMSKDYQGHGVPRHRPPINNKEPLKEEHEIP